MVKKENIQDFYARLKLPAGAPIPLGEDNAGAGHFNVFLRGNCSLTPYSRRDFYKVSLILGTGRLHYADKWIEIDRPALLFSNPLVPYAWEPQSSMQAGWFCIFSETFMSQEDRKGFLHESPLFRVGGNPVFFLDPEQVDEISGIFRKMVANIASDYAHKYSLLRNYLYLIIHEAMKMRPASEYRQPTNASVRITELFLELLERQFPIDSPEAELKLKTAKDFATNLSLHANSLNRSVKEVTGKTTTEHIAGRITNEAKALLANTDWDVAQIAYGLGFEYPSYFSNFFRKQTGLAPGAIRASPV